MKQTTSISESEWKVMKVIWSDPPKTLHDILAALKHTEWSTTTIQTYLARLLKKGVLSAERHGKGFLYYPVVSEDNCQLSEGKSFLNRVYDGSLVKMVSGFIKCGNLSDDELAELKKLIEEREKK